MPDKSNATGYRLYMATGSEPASPSATTNYDLVAYDVSHNLGAGINTEDDSTKADGNWSRDFVTHRAPEVRVSGKLAADADTGQDYIHAAAYTDYDYATKIWFLLTNGTTGDYQWRGEVIVSQDDLDLPLRGRGTFAATLKVQGALTRETAP